MIRPSYQGCDACLLRACLLRALNHQGGGVNVDDSRHRVNEMGMRWRVLAFVVLSPALTACVRAGFNGPSTDASGRDGAGATDGASATDGRRDRAPDQGPLTLTSGMAQRHGGSSAQPGELGASVAVDTKGNVYIAGAVNATGGGGTRDILLWSTDAAGTLRWTKTVGGSGEDYATGIVALGDAIYVVGQFAGGASAAVNFDGAILTPHNANAEGFIWRLDANGSTVAGWPRVLGGAGWDRAAAIAVSPAGELLVAGQFAASIDLGGGVITSHGAADLFVLKLSAGGAHQLSAGFGGTGLDTAEAIAVDAAGNLFVTGSFSATVDLGGGLSAVSRGGTDAFLLALDNQAKPRWVMAAGSPLDDTGSRLALSGQDVCVAGGFYDTLTFADASALVSGGDCDVFLTCLAASDGARRWARAFGGAQCDSAGGLARHPGGLLYLAGSIGAPATLGGPPLVPSARDLFVAAYASDGSHRYSGAFGGAGDDVAEGLLITAQGALVVSGRISQAVDLLGIPLQSAGHWDAFVWRLASN